MTPKREVKIIKCAVYVSVSTENQAEKDYSPFESRKEHILNFTNAEMGAGNFLVFMDM